MFPVSSGSLSPPPAARAVAPSAGANPSGLHIPKMIRNAPSPTLHDLVTSGVPELVETLACLSPRDFDNLGNTCAGVSTALEWVRGLHSANNANNAKALFTCAAEGDDDGVGRFLVLVGGIDKVFDYAVEGRSSRLTALSVAVLNNFSGVVDQLVKSDHFDPNATASVDALRIATDLTFRSDGAEYLGGPDHLYVNESYRSDRKAFREARQNSFSLLLRRGVSVRHLSDEQWESGLEGDLWLDVAPHFFCHPAAATSPVTVREAWRTFKNLTRDQVQMGDQDGKTLLHRAVSLNLRGGSGLLNYICSRDRADPDVSDNNGRTPLHDAAACGNLGAVCVLLRRGAKPNVRDTNGKTPLDAARTNGHYKVIEKLRPIESRNGHQARPPVVS
jgi:Ankyrin repeats (many copies)